MANANRNRAASDADGLVRLPADPDIGQSVRRRARLEKALGILSPLLILVLWEIVVRAGLLDARIVPAPSMILETFKSLIESGELARHVGVSLTRVFVGLLLGAMPGLVVGTLMGLSPMTRAIVSPIVASLYPIPKIAIFPLVMAIFGIGELSKYVLVAIAVFFFMAINSFAGVANVDRIYWDVGRSFGVSRSRAILTIALPGALPMILAGLRLSLGVSLLVLVGAEFVGAKSGIGYLVWNSWQVFDVESMYAGIVVIGLLGWAFFAVLDELERRLVPWGPGNRR
ncbi:ABC transporter permease [Reyranella sp. CPCC 100927]|uniref:ABC transporter permease n=1 Tax=Reyranella sp. CPCC 100927 TaxID=2599616 RepID=UPI0011B39E82|nr:ABC transporter permease [Reyranella sp. CPCC 100927]TWS97316.1 ABC transporter permease [Reyranella sp. CPCC 100927]